MGGGHQEVNRPSEGEIAKVMERARVGGGTIGEMATPWARGMLGVTVLGHQVRRWEVFDIDQARRGVGDVFPRSKPGVLP